MKEICTLLVKLHIIFSRMQIVNQHARPSIIQVGCPTCCYQVCALDHANVGTADLNYSSGLCYRNGITVFLHFLSQVCWLIIIISIYVAMYQNLLSIHMCVSHHQQKPTDVTHHAVMHITSYYYDVIRVCPDTMLFSTNNHSIANVVILLDKIVDCSLRGSECYQRCQEFLVVVRFSLVTWGMIPSCHTSLFELCKKHMSQSFYFILFSPTLSFSILLWLPSLIIVVMHFAWLDYVSYWWVMLFLT